METQQRWFNFGFFNTYLSKQTNNNIQKQNTKLLGTYDAQYR